MLTSMLALVGVYNYQHLPIDAVPDITNVQVQINTEAGGYSPLEVERRITYPIEGTLSGLPHISYTRSLSRYGLSQVTAVFEDGTDIYFARQLVSERLQQIASTLPDRIIPLLGPLSTGLGEIFMYTVENKSGEGKQFSPTDLRTAQDWIVRPQLRTVSGVVEVNSVGGFERQYAVTPKMERLLALGITMHDLVEVIAGSDAAVGAGFIERGGQQYLVRVPGQLVSLEEVEELVVTVREGKPIFIRDVADVALGNELRRGAATENGSEVVLGTVFMLVGENSRAVSKRVASRMEEINRSLPKGMTAETVYDRTVLVDKTIETVRKNLLEGAALVIVILFLFLRNFRAALLTSLVIPLSMLFTITGMVTTKISANLMSLGALDFGLIVDGSIIIVENCLRRLRAEQKRLGRLLTLKERLEVVFAAAKEVRQATMFGELIIMIVYLPILTLTGVEGKMFHPMAMTVIIALFGAMIFSVTFVPAAVAILLGNNFQEEEGKLMRRTREKYGKALQVTLRRPMVPIIATGVLFVISLFAGAKLGTEFIPSLDEGDIALHALRIPGTSLSQAVDMQKALEERIRKFPEVARTFTKIGTAEIATDPMPPSVADGFVILKAREEWPDPKKSKEKLVEEIESALSHIPGNNYEFTQPIEMRFNELIAGVRSDVAIKIFGDDMDVLLREAEEIQKLLEGVKGSADVKVEPVTGLPVLTVTIDRKKLSRFGIKVSDVQEIISTAIGGKAAGEVIDGDRRFPIVVRLPEKLRSDLDALSSLPIPLPRSERRKDSVTTVLEHEDEPLRSFIPLSSVAEISIVTGPNQVSRENGKRLVVVTANVRGRDLGGFVNEAEIRLNEENSLPAGYWRSWGGQFEQLISAKKRLYIVVPLALTLILMLLYYTFGNVTPALLVFSGVPLALSGGIFSLLARGLPFSITAAVGFIALSGVAVLNGLVMLSFIRKLRDEGRTVDEAISEGCSERLRPILMTALVASFGFLPMALATGAGAEVQRPLATVVIGGILTSTFLTLFVLPAMYRLLYRTRQEELP